MAIAFDADVAISATTGTQLTWSHTCTGSNLILLVEVVSGLGASDNVTGVTYNSVALTLVTGSNTRPAGTDRWRSLWYLLGPATGANTVAVNGTPSAYIQASSVSYTGVDQTTGVEAQATNTATAATTLSQAVTTITANAWVIGSASADVNPNYTGGTNTNRVDNPNTNFITSTLNPIVTPASTTLQINNVSSSDMIMTVISMKPFVAAGGTISTPIFNNLLTLGVS